MKFKLIASDENWGSCALDAECSNVDKRPARAAVLIEWRGWLLRLCRVDAAQLALGIQDLIKRESCASFVQDPVDEFSLDCVLCGRMQSEHSANSVTIIEEKTEQ